MERLNTYDKIREVARLYAEGATITEIAKDFDVPKIAIENTIELIRDIVEEINKSPLFADNDDIPEDNGPNFLTMGEIMHGFIMDNFVDAVVVEEYYSNRENEAVVIFTEKSGEYSLAIHKET